MSSSPVSSSTSSGSSPSIKQKPAPVSSEVTLITPFVKRLLEAQALWTGHCEGSSSVTSAFAKEVISVRHEEVKEEFEERKKLDAVLGLSGKRQAFLESYKSYLETLSRALADSPEVHAWMASQSSSGTGSRSATGSPLLGWIKRRGSPSTPKRRGHTSGRSFGSVFPFTPSGRRKKTPSPSSPEGEQSPSLLYEVYEDVVKGRYTQLHEALQKALIMHTLHQIAAEGSLKAGLEEIVDRGFKVFEESKQVFTESLETPASVKTDDVLSSQYSQCALLFFQALRNQISIIFNATVKGDGKKDSEKISDDEVDTMIKAVTKIASTLRKKDMSALTEEQRQYILCARYSSVPFGAETNLCLAALLVFSKGFFEDLFKTFPQVKTSPQDAASQQKLDTYMRLLRRFAPSS